MVKIAWACAQAFCLIKQLADLLATKLERKRQLDPRFCFRVYIF